MTSKDKYIDIKEFSKFIVHYFNSRGSLITNKKLQKLLYYTQAWHLVYFNGHQLFKEVPEAWVHGAVYPSVYSYYKKFKAKPIVFDDSNTIGREELLKIFNSFDLSKEQQEYIISVLSTYGKKDAFELELLNHREKPWLEARGDLEDYDISRKSIDINTMENYYSELIKNSKNVL